MIYILLCLIILIVTIKYYEQKKQINEITATIEEVINGQTNLHLFAKNNNELSNLIFNINKLIDLYKNEKQISQKEQMSRKRLLSNLSHDVRTPLVSVIGYLEAVTQNRIKDNNKDDYIITALNKSQELKKQINELFELVQLDSKEITLHKEKIDICEILRQAIIDFLPMIEKENITLKTDIPENELFINTDKKAVYRVFQNLISNTLKHAKKGKYLGVFVSIDNEHILIDIKDKGIGISKEHIPFIFDRLYKADNVRTRGGGIGLAVSKELTEKMDGKIEVLKSIPGNTIFRTTFPLSK